MRLAEERILAKAGKDFSRADRLRDEIEKAGYQIEDAKEGYKIRKKS
jgi:cysteinyl-tRNA synthetase